MAEAAAHRHRKRQALKACVASAHPDAADCKQLIAGANGFAIDAASALAAWQQTCLGNAMSNHKEVLVIKELQELKNLETRLQSKWNTLQRAGTDVRASFVASLRELQMRAANLERALD